MSGLLDFLTPGASELDQARGLNDADTTLTAAGQFIAAASRFRFSAEQQQALDFQAAQLRQQASDAAAAGQRSAWTADQQTRYIASKALAAAAAGGGGASDPTVVGVISKIASEGAYRQATALYQGEDRERLLNLQAEAKQYEGEVASGQQRMAGATQSIAGAASLLRGTARDASLLQRFGAGGPRMDATPNTIY